MMTLALHSVRGERRLLREEGDTRHEQNGMQESGSHVTVLASEAVNLLSLRDGDTVIDATAGQGGHSVAMLERARISLIALDADPRAIAFTKARIAAIGKKAQVVESNFADIESVLNTVQVRKIDKVLFDLGWNKSQLSDGRGLSFQVNEPLSMSYGPVPASGFIASEILNHWNEKAIANVLFGYGEETYARKIARAVVAARDIKPFATTNDLIEVLEDVLPVAYKRRRLHFATKTFQALRIAVNDELGVVERGISAAWAHLTPGGRIAVITFHSIEDRVVKHLFAAYAKEGAIKVTKKPVVPSSEEVRVNPSARSAKLRAIEKSL